MIRYDFICSNEDYVRDVVLEVVSQGDSIRVVNGAAFSNASSIVIRGQERPIANINGNVITVSPAFTIDLAPGQEVRSAERMCILTLDQSGPDGIYTAQCRQTECSGYTAPFVAEKQYPIGRVLVTHTPYTVPSLGCNLERFAYTDDPPTDARSTIDTGVASLVGFWAGETPPVGIPGNMTRFGYRWSGKFYARHGGSLRFRFIGSGYVKFTFAGDVLLASDLGTTAYTEVEVPDAVVEGGWYDFEVLFFNKAAKDIGFLASWKSGAADAFPAYLPVSAGVVVRTSDSGFLTSYELPNVIGEQHISQRQGEAAEFEFTVPLVADGGDEEGYLWDESTYSLKHCSWDASTQSYRYQPDGADAGLTIRLGDLLRYEEGYRSGCGDEEYISRFTGHVHQVRHRRERGRDVAVVVCRDFGQMLVDSFVENSPSRFHYWMAGFGDKHAGESLDDGTLCPEGIAAVPAWDRWPLRWAYMALLVEAGVDPTLFERHRMANALTGEQGSESDWLIQDPKPAVYLDHRSWYPNPAPSEASAGADSTGGDFLFVSDYGTPIADVVKSIADQFLYEYGFDAGGYPYLRGFDVPISIVGTDGVTYSGTGWDASDRTSDRAIKGTYRMTDHNGDSVSLVFTGERIAASIVRFNRTAPCTVEYWVRRQSDGKYAYRDGGRTLYSDLFHSQTLDTSYAWQDVFGQTQMDRFYYDGYDTATGVNPCEVEIMSGLTFEPHEVVMKLSDGGADAVFGFNAFLVYDVDTDKPVVTLSTGTSTRPGQIVRMPSASLDMGDLRNSFTIVGSRVVSAGYGATGVEGIYVTSKAVDTRSMLDPDARNFVGRERKAVVIESSIRSRDRADFLALHSLMKYRQIKPALRYKMLPNPLLEPGDCIAVRDETKGTVDEAQPNWITAIESTMSPERGEYLADVETTPVKPERSYVSFPGADVDTVGSIILDLEITVGGARDKGTADGWDSLGGDLYQLTDTSKNWSTDQWTTDRWGTSEGFEVYDEAWQRFTITSNTTHTITARAEGSYSPVGTNYVILSKEGRTSDHPYDPFWFDEVGDVVQVSFKLMKRAQVRVNVIRRATRVALATLLDAHATEFNDETGWQWLTPGQYTLGWDGVDQFEGGHNASMGIGRGFIMAMADPDTPEELYVEIDVIDEDGQAWQIRSDDDGIGEPTTHLGQQLIYLKVGESATASIEVQPAWQAGTSTQSPSYIWDRGDDSTMTVRYSSTGPRRLMQLEYEIEPYWFYYCDYGKEGYLELWEMQHAPDGQKPGAKSVADNTFRDRSAEHVLTIQPAVQGIPYTVYAPAEMRDALYSTGYKRSPQEVWLASAIKVHVRMIDRAGNTIEATAFQTLRGRDYESEQYSYSGTVVDHNYAFAFIGWGAVVADAPDSTIWLTKVYEA